MIYVHMKHAFHWHFYLTTPLENKGKRKAKFHFSLYHAKVSLLLLKYHWFLCKSHNKKDPDLQKSRPKRQTSARSRSLSYTVWFDSVLLLCLDTQCTISSCIATGFFPVKRLPEADRILQKIIPCIHRIKPFPRIRVLPQNRIYGFALWQNLSYAFFSAIAACAAARRAIGTRNGEQDT